MKRVALLLCAAAMAACQYTPAQLQAEVPPVTYPSSLNYQTAYRLLTERMRDCYQRGGEYVQVQVNSDLYTDIQKGEIAVIILGTGSTVADETIDIVPNGTGSTIALRERPAPLRMYPVAPLIPRWLAGSTEC